MPLNFKTILRGTPSNRFNNASHVKISKIKVTRKAGVIQKAECRSSTPGSSKTYDSEVEFIQSGKFVKLSCSCDDFLFRFEYALYRRGSADIRHSNGQSPDVTNPSLTPGCCKHLIAMRDVLIAKNIIEP